MIDPEFGYYICNGVQFQKKIEALLYGKTESKPVSWYLQDHLYSNYPWHIEPEQSLDELYDRRARELREKYDYIVLSFSGGSDSFNILESFIRQNLHIDEIVTSHHGYSEKTHAALNTNITANWNYAAEHVLNTMPRLKYASEKLPKTKITLVDETNNLFDAIKQYEDENWIFKRNDHLGALMPLKYNFFDIKKLRTEFDKDKSIGIVWGRDKPKIKIQNNKFYTTFNDITLNATHMVAHNSEYTNVKTESFYWNSSCLDMLAKQAHVVKRWIETTPSVQRYWLENSMVIRRQLHEILLRKVIYSTWNESWFQIEKPVSQWHTQFDEWFRRDPNLSKDYTLWQRGIKQAVNLLSEHINFTNGVPDNLKLFEKSYLIGPANLQSINHV
jgi:hypothetical protein